MLRSKWREMSWGAKYVKNYLGYKLDGSSFQKKLEYTGESTFLAKKESIIQENNKNKNEKNMDHVFPSLSFGSSPPSSLQFLLLEQREKKNEKQRHADDFDVLIVLLHGLNSHPVYFDVFLKYVIDMIEKQHSQMYQDDPRRQKVKFIAPSIKNKGKCKLTEGATPVWREIQDVFYRAFDSLFSDETEKNIERDESRIREMLLRSPKKIVLVGSSNGARIAAFLDLALRKHPLLQNIPVMLIGVAGVFMGTTYMNLFDRTGLARIYYPSCVVDELKYNSNVAQFLIEELKRPLEPFVKRRYIFYATKNDSKVAPIESSLPTLNQGELKVTLSGVEHSSLIDDVAPLSAAHIQNFIFPFFLASENH